MADLKAQCKEVFDRLHRMGEEQIKNGETLVVLSVHMNKRLDSMTQAEMRRSMARFHEKCPFLFTGTNHAWLEDIIKGAEKA